MGIPVRHISNVGPCAVAGNMEADDLTLLLAPTTLSVCLWRAVVIVNACDYRVSVSGVCVRLFVRARAYVCISHDSHFLTPALIKSSHFSGTKTTGLSAEPARTFSETST